MKVTVAVVDCKGVFGRAAAAAALSAMILFGGRSAGAGDPGRGDDAIRARVRAIAAIEDSAADPSAVDPLAETCAWAAAAPASDVRAVIEKTPRDLAAGAVAIVDALSRRPEPEFRALAADLAARLCPPAAEAALLAQLAAPPERIGDRRPAIEQLGRVAVSPAAWSALSALLAHGAPELRTAAADAIEEAHDRLLGLARTADVEALLATARAVAPDEAMLLFHAATDRGVYENDPAAGLRLVDDWLARHDDAPDAAGSTTPIDVHSMRLARIVLLELADRHADAEIAARLALARCERPPSRARDAAIATARLRCMLALFALRRGDEERARRECRAAIGVAPADRSVAMFDAAFDGSFGPYIVLDALRRRGESDLPARFFAMVEAVLADAEAGTTLGLPRPPERVRGESERIKSWAPLRRMLALEQRGALDDARDAARRITAALADADFFNNRWMLAEATCATGRIDLALGDLDAADAASDAAVRLFDELDTQWRDSDVEEMASRFPPGTPPFPHPLGAERARALLVRSEVLRRRGNDEAARSSARLATRADPRSDAALIADAAFAVGGAGDAGAAAASGRTRGARILAQTPPRADCLFGLARLAARLGDADRAIVLLGTHLAWNALTPERRTIERARIRADRDFASLAADPRFAPLRAE